MPTKYQRASFQSKLIKRLTLRKVLRTISEKCIPNIFIIILGMFFSAPFYIPGQSEMQIGLILGTVWFWALYYPRSMPLVLLFISGLIIELFVTTPPGLLLLWMLVVYGVAYVVRFRLRQGNFFKYWALYSGTILIGSIVEWGLLSLRATLFLPFSAILFEWILIMGVYPLLHVMFIRGRWSF